ncbi:MAG TPA: glycine zipper domain-containing protein [Roseomonas sp.]|nr:glycine zipper domain-containing protein [Roseomonas sp.]
MSGMMKVPATVLAIGLTLGGCSEMSDTSRRTLTGAGAGAAGGAVIGSLTGDFGWGALIGAGVGAAGGYLYDQHKQTEQAAYHRGVQAGQAGRR